MEDCAAAMPPSGGGGGATPNAAGGSGGVDVFRLEATVEAGASAGASAFVSASLILSTELTVAEVLAEAALHAVPGASEDDYVMLVRTGGVDAADCALLEADTRQFTTCDPSVVSAVASFAAVRVVLRRRDSSHHAHAVGHSQLGAFALQGRPIRLYFQRSLECIGVIGADDGSQATDAATCPSAKSVVVSALSRLVRAGLVPAHSGADAVMSISSASVVCEDGTPVELEASLSECAYVQECLSRNATPLLFVTVPALAEEAASKSDSEGDADGVLPAAGGLAAVMAQQGSRRGSSNVRGLAARARRLSKADALLQSTALSVSMGGGSVGAAGARKESVALAIPLSPREVRESAEADDGDEREGASVGGLLQIPSPDGDAADDEEPGSATGVLLRVPSADGPGADKKVVKRRRKHTNQRPMSRVAGFSPVAAMSIEFVLPNGFIVSLPCPGDRTVSQTKASVWDHAKATGHDSNLKQHDLYVLKYVKDGRAFELYDEEQPSLKVSLKKASAGKKEKMLDMKIGDLIGYGLYQYGFLKNDEVDTIRRKLASVRQQAVQGRDLQQYIMEPSVTSQPIPPHIRAKMPGDKIQMRVHFGTEFSKTVLPSTTSKPAEVLASIFTKQNLARMNLPPESKPDDFILKVCGMREYICGDHCLGDFKYIRTCILKEEPIDLTAVAVADLKCEAEIDDDEEDDLIDDSSMTGTHEQLTARGREHTQIATTSLWDIARRFRVRILGVDSLNTGNVQAIYVEAGIYHGGQLMAPVLKTSQVASSENPRWSEWLVFDIATYNIPRASRLCVTVYGRWNARKKMAEDKEDDLYPLGWVSTLLMNYKGFLRAGVAKLHLWAGEKANPIGTTVANPKQNESAAVYLEFDTHRHPVAFPTEKYANVYKDLEVPAPPDESDNRRLEVLMSSDPLTRLDRNDDKLLWLYRYYCMRRPEALPKFLLAVRWNEMEHVKEVHRMLLAWAPLPPDAALELLDANFADERVRAYAVERLDVLSNDELSDFLLQLVQVLKYEPYHDSALARFLLKRALKNRRIGHSFFWYLRSEMQTPEISQRFGLLLEAYVRGCGSVVMDELMREATALNKLVKIANAIKTVKGAERKEVLRQKLAEAQLPESFSLAYNPNLVVGNIKVEKCKYMDSKKLPLWLVFENADSSATRPVYIIFKSGDDLRQDMLTLQMLQIMDKLWQANNLDFRMLPYGCISTGNEVGMIEVVLNAETVANIQQAKGGAMASFKDEILRDWLRAQNPNDKDFDKAVQTFTLSCAGYCVATYVLGIGDRHNDNIMVTKSGHLFHIDFGHFLGNFKSKFGVKRERAPFVLTPDFVFVMGRRDGEQFAKFQEYCCQAYLILRRHANMLINLFAMMLSTGIPELKSVEDIYYLRDALCLGMTEEQAANSFKDLIFECLRLSWSTQLNWAIHNLAHSK